ncbi:MAG: PEP-CTERM sorting domain-containing protein [Planctomycetota bacterium]
MIRTAMTTAALLSAASAYGGVFTDTASSGGFFTTANDNTAIYTGGSGGIFEVQFYTYDGDGSTVEDEQATSSFDYFVGNPNLGLPAGDTFVRLEVDARFWDGRTSNDGQVPSDVFTYQLSDDGVNYGSVQTLTFDPITGSGIFDTTGTSAPFEADYVRINLLARTESAGSGSNDPWSSQLSSVTLTSAVPEPASAAVVLAGLVGCGLRRRSR